VRYAPAEAVEIEVVADVLFIHLGHEIVAFQFAEPLYPASFNGLIFLAFEIEVFSWSSAYCPSAPL
jgi:hypothetical protein